MDRVVGKEITLPSNWFSRISTHARVEAPTLAEWLAALSSSLLLVLAFPNFNIFPLAWVGLVPLLVVIARRPSTWRSFVLGWTCGTLFFFASCSWLTYSMIHFGGLTPLVAYLLLLLPSLLVGLFPALFALFVSITIRRLGLIAIFAAPLFWSALEWARLEVTGQLWNAIGYSQAEAFSGVLIQGAKWGGVYAVGALLVTLNAAIAFLLLDRSRRAVVTLMISMLVLSLLIAASNLTTRDASSSPYLNVIALQPNVPESLSKSNDELKELFNRHLSMSREALQSLPPSHLPTLVVWPESPMNFTYATDSEFRAAVTKFAVENHASLLFNSLEPAPNDGGYNSALLINEDGRVIAQYDKIRLMPFGEYVPLPRWIPGASLITALVGEFTPGNKFALMPVARHEAGTFICIESAYPFIAREFAAKGADFLINISNDGYLGPTAVMHQHLANAIFRAVENGLPLVSVTNSGVSAMVGRDGVVHNPTDGFQIAIRTWQLDDSITKKTFYTRHGDVFAWLMVASTILILLACLIAQIRSSKVSRWKRI